MTHELAESILWRVKYAEPNGPFSPGCDRVILRGGSQRRCPMQALFYGQKAPDSMRREYDKSRRELSHDAGDLRSFAMEVQ